MIVMCADVPVNRVAPPVARVSDKMFSYAGHGRSCCSNAKRTMSGTFMLHLQFG